MSTSTDSVAEMVQLIAKALVDKPEEVSVRSIAGRQGGVVELLVDPSDLGKVIGKKGRTAKSIRTLLDAVGVKTDRRFSLEIIEP